MSDHKEPLGPETKPSYVVEAGEAIFAGRIMGIRSGMTRALLDGNRVTRAIVGKIFDFSSPADFGTDEYICDVIRGTLQRTFNTDTARKLGDSLPVAIEKANADIADRGCEMVVAASGSLCTYACSKQDCPSKSGFLG